MAEIVRYVDTDVSGGAGDGTSWANAYATLAAWEAAEDSNLDLVNNWMHCYVSGATEDTAQVYINGWTTSAADYIKIEAADETDHTDRARASQWDDTRYRLSVTNDAAMAIAEEYVWIDGLQIEVADIDADYEVPIIIAAAAATNNLVRISNCRLRSNNDAAQKNQNVRIVDADSICQIWNCILEGVNAVHANCVNILAGGATLDVYNCTIYGGSGGINKSAGTVNVYSTAVLNTADDFAGSPDVISHCASDDNDTTDDTNVAESGGDADWTGDFTDGSGGNWTLISSSNLIGAGATASSIFTTDIDGTTRSGWDVGAFEYVAAGGTTYTDSVTVGTSISDAGSGSASLSLTAAAVAMPVDAGGGSLVAPVTAASVATGNDAGAAAFSLLLSAVALAVAADVTSQQTTIAVSVADESRGTDIASLVRVILGSIADGAVVDDAGSAGYTIGATVADTVSTSVFGTALMRIIAAVSDGISPATTAAITTGTTAEGKAVVTITVGAATITISGARATAAIAGHEATVLLSGG